MEELENKEQVAETTDDGVCTVVDIHFRSGGKTYYFDPAGLSLSAGDAVIIDTARGPEFGTCSSGCHSVAAKDVVTPLRRVIRKATEADKKTAAANREKEKRAYSICQQKIAEHKLDMQLVSAECAFDGSKILFFFTADGRVDFRELVKNLASIFRTRIELRQIGVRDKAKMVGGLGVCGRPFCCSQFLSDFQPVSIKMAKTQSLSLNPTKISGTCGRLMCCLKYEQEAYEDLLKTAPKAESFVDTPDGRGTVTDVNLLRQTVKVRMEEQPDTISCYHNCDICILRNGKARKNDPPIPKDLAPISSKRKSVRKPLPADELPPLEPIIFHSEAANTPIPAPEAETSKPAERASAGTQPRRRKRRRGSSNPAAGSGEARDAQQPAKPPRPQQPAGEQKPRPPRPAQADGAAPQSGEGGEKKPKSRHRYRRRKPKPQTPPSSAPSNQ